MGWDDFCRDSIKLQKAKKKFPIGCLIKASGLPKGRTYPNVGVITGYKEHPLYGIELQVKWGDKTYRAIKKYQVNGTQDLVFIFLKLEN